MSRRGHDGPAATRLGWRDTVAEALAGVVQRPGRSVLTLLGTVLGVGAFVAVQVSKRWDAF
jgi:putative ABC transport system permease protein